VTAPRQRRQPVTVSKHRRQHLIAELLEAQPVGSQAQLVALLETRGVSATQATVSRDLEELGAVKIRVAGGDTAYALPEQSTPTVPQEQLRRVLGEWALAVHWSGTLVVVRTPPGSAHVVASAVDRSGFAGVVGTVAGDDTVLVVADEEVGAPAVAGALRRLAGLALPGEDRDIRPGRDRDAQRAADESAGAATADAAARSVTDAAGHGPGPAGGDRSTQIEER
jgi:transcriptional regulator of arginine metabolism